MILVLPVVFETERLQLEQQQLQQQRQVMFSSKKNCKMGIYYLSFDSPKCSILFKILLAWWLVVFIIIFKNIMSTLSMIIVFIALE